MPDVPYVTTWPGVDTSHKTDSFPPPSAMTTMMMTTGGTAIPSYLRILLMLEHAIQHDKLTIDVTRPINGWQLSLRRVSSSSNVKLDYSIGVNSRFCVRD